MSVFEVAALGAALGADSFSVSVGIGLGGVHLRRALKLAALFGVFQGVLLFAGGRLAGFLHWLLDFLASTSGPLARLASDADFLAVQGWVEKALSLVGAAILTYVGISLIRGFLKRGEESKPVFYKGRLALSFLALSVSIDAFSAGLGLGFNMLRSTGLPLIAFGVTLVVSAMAFFGLRAGKRIARVIGRKAEPAGGLILIALAVHLAIQAFVA